MNNTLLGSSTWSQFEGWEAEEALNGGNYLIGPVVKNGSKIKGKFLGITPKRHLISVAPTRSGKGVSLIIPNLLLYRGSAIVIDPKGENAWITAKYRREVMDHKTIILDPWNEVNRRYGDKTGELETVARFNPLSILDPKSENYADDIAYLADALIINQGKDPHWDNSARELVAGLIAYTIEVAPEKFRSHASLSEVRELLAKPVKEIMAMALKAQNFGTESLAARKLGRFQIDSNETASIISTALTQTAFLDSAPLTKNMQESDFSFEDLINGQTTIYLVLPVDKLQTYGRWLRLMVSIGIRTIARNVKKLLLPVLFMLDEFGTIGKLSAVAQAYGLMAGLQMIIWAFVQDLNQLKRDYPEDWETFIANSSAVTFFNIMDQFTAKYLSELCGVTTVERLSEETESKRTALIFRDPDHISAADQVQARPLIHPAEIRCITSEVGIMIWPSQPINFSPINYYDEPFFLSRARVDPHFPEMLEAQLKLFTGTFLQEAKTQFPDWKAARAFLEKRGFKVEDHGLLGIKIKITLPNGKEEVFSNPQAVLSWVWEIAAREKLAGLSAGQ